MVILNPVELIIYSSQTSTVTLAAVVQGWELWLRVRAPGLIEAS